MKVREANAGDLKIIVDFQLRMAFETEQIRLDPATVTKGVQAVLADHSKGVYYVADENGIIQGSLLTTYEWSDWRNGRVLWIQSVYVRPGKRQQGIYSQLYRHIQERVLADPSLFGIRLYADASNSTAHRAYLNLGMNADHYITYEWMKG